MGALLALALRRRALDKGLREGSTLWLLIGAISVVHRLYRKIGPRTETVRLGERLRPGDELTLRYPGKAGRKVRKETRLVAAKRTAAQKAYDEQRAALVTVAAGSGRKARKAQRHLDALVEPRV